jgi:hypothetical protein
VSYASDKAAYRRALVNNFAIRSFRDVADQDYIAARSCYRSSLFPQFRWSALQTVEKYLKGILLLNRIPARDLKHDLSKALDRCTELPFEIKMADGTRQLIAYLDDSAQYRYLEGSYYVHGPKLMELDRAIWQVRRYCRPLNYSLKRVDGTNMNMLEAELATIDAAEARPYHKFQILGGHLERIISDHDHPAREALVWNNMFFGRKSRRSVKMRIPMHAENAPLWLHPEILDDVIKFVYLPKDVAEAYRKELKRRQQQSK